jgi:hypothetical protein
MNEISIEKRYVTRNGRFVRLLCTDGPEILPVIAIVYSKNPEDNPVLCTYNKIGLAQASLGKDFDLVEVKKTFAYQRWANIYPEGVYDLNSISIWETREEANRMALINKQIACIPILFAGTEGDGLDEDKKEERSK